MFFPNKIAGCSEARRVLKPGGSFVFNIWDEIESNEFSNLVTLAAHTGCDRGIPDDPPMFLARTPHGYHDVELIRSDLNAVGFSDVSIETLEKISTLPQRAIR